MAGAPRGAVIVAPSLLPDVHLVIISCVRFLLYGLFAAGIALPCAKALISQLRRRDLWRLLELAITGNVVYFMLLSAAVQCSGVALAALINGLIPVAIVLMGKRCSPARSGGAALPLALLCGGVAWINLPALRDLASGQGSGLKALGALFALLGVIPWSWFALRNAQHLKTGRFSPGNWSTLQGMATGVVALFITLGVCVFQPQ